MIVVINTVKLRSRSTKGQSYKLSFVWCALIIHFCSKLNCVNKYEWLLWNVLVCDHLTVSRISRDALINAALAPADLHWPLWLQIEMIILSLSPGCEHGCNEFSSKYVGNLKLTSDGLNCNLSVQMD